jgi:hypothetical protein
MGSFPTSPRADFLAWCQAHVDVFTTNAQVIGLTPDQATAFATATQQAASAAQQQESGRLAFRAATQDASDKFADLRSSASEMVRSIRTYAENTTDPSVYVTAQVPPPQDPSTAPPPGQPFDLRVALDAGTGALELRWKASNPQGTSGTSYIIRRRVSEAAPFEFVGVTGEKRFVDTTFFAGPDSVQYTIQGQRADRAGAVSGVLTVSFGRSGPGAAPGFTIAGVNGGEAERLAA